MANREKNPERCRELRQIERAILSELAQISDDISRTWRNINGVRSELSILRAKRESLQKQLAFATAASAMRGSVGAALGASLVKLEIAYELVRQEITHLVSQNTQFETDADQLQRDHDRWTASLEENAQRLHALDCVTDS